jgi:hypothetical protein
MKTFVIQTFLTRNILLLGLICGTAFAGPITYDFNFAVTGGFAPTSGSFTYDASAASNPFSSFEVVWDGVTFDFTASANSGGLAQGSACGTASTANVFLELIAAACTPTNTTNWFIAAGSPATFNLNDVYAGPPISAQSVFAPTSLTGSPGSFGQWSLTEAATTPEPSAFMLLLVGFSFLARTGARRARESSSSHGRALHFRKG